MLNTQPEILASAANERPRRIRTNSPSCGGGALFRLWRRTRLSGDALEFTRRRVLAVIAITWVPLLVLSIRKVTPGEAASRSRSCGTWKRTCAS